MMLYAQIVLGLPVDGPFDYSIPDGAVATVKAGCRVRIHFRNKKEIGYVIGVSDKTDISSVKPIIEVIDTAGPLLSKPFLDLALRLSRYYYCSLGEAIAAGLPMALRRGRPVPGTASIPAVSAPHSQPRRLLIHDLDVDGRIPEYQDHAQVWLQQQKSVIVLVPDKDAAGRMHKVMEARFPGMVCVLLREGAQEIQQWLHARNTSPVLVIGTRSAVFAPVHDLGCIIIDEEHDYGYKQDQSPHYHARDVAMMRCDIEGADFIAGSAAPSLEMMHAVAKGEAAREVIPRSRTLAQVRIVDMKKLPLVSKRQKITVSGYLENAMLTTMAAGGKVLIFLNRKGYATLAICSHCSKVFQCPRCSVNLNFHYESKVLRCHYCNYSVAPPTICPECNAGYVRFLGAGTEKLENELCRKFPKAGITRWESGMPLAYDDADIIIATQAGIRHAQARFGLVAMLGIDNALNHVDFRSAEKAFGTMACLFGLADKQIVVQTNMPDHYVLRALTQNDPDIFYQEEFRQRKQLSFPPYRHFALIKFRGKLEEKVARAARSAYDGLAHAVKPAGISIVSVNPAQQSKLRGNYYWVILIACKDIGRLYVFLKKHLTAMRYSGIIVTVDVDPV